MIKIILTCMVFLFPSSLLAQATEASGEASDTDENIKDVLYVTDQLRLSVYPQADAKSGSLQLLSSGDRLEVLQISGNYALVRTPNGKQGWVKRGFLVPEPTANLLLKQERLKIDELNQEIDKFANSKMVINQYEIDMDAMSENIRTLEAEIEMARTTISNLEMAALKKTEMEAAIEASVESNSALPMKALLTTAITYWQYMIPVILLFVLMGFLIGKLVIEFRIRKRFHGVKIW
jgi:SH3 domain protein